MKIVVAPDSFKGCLRAAEVARAVASGLRACCPGAEVVEVPLADGGEGTLAVLTSALGGTVCGTMVQDPLGRPVEARFGTCADTAIIEVAEACGLQRLAPEERNPLRASSYGVGELLLAARRQGARHFLIGLGGTATSDGGAGMLQVPGLREALRGCTLELLCDVDNPFVGPRGAARVFAPQKGASPADVDVLENRLEALAERFLAETGVDVRALPGAGAAGGLGGAFLAYFGASRVSGIDKVLELLRFDELVRDADFIVTGEGKSDRQTLGGKVPLGVLRHAQGKPVFLLSGRIEDRDELQAAGFARLVQVSPDGLPLEEATKPAVAAENLRKSAREVAL